MTTSQEANVKLKSKVRPEPKVFGTWVLAIVMPIVLILLTASPLGWDLFFEVFGTPIGLLIWALNSVWAAVLTVRLARHDRWLGALLISTLPALLVVAIVTMPSPIRIINMLGDELHFLVMRQTYLAEIAAIPPTSEPRLVQFDLGGMIWFHGAIVYDESDELGLSLSQRSQAWKDRAYKTLECEPEVHLFLFLQFTGLTQHFYLAYFPC